MKTQAIRIHAHGGPEVLSLDEVEIPAPGPGEALVRNTAIGVNYADIYEREGDHGGPHSAKPFPVTMGHMAVGVVETPGADGPGAGTRVGYIGGNSYAGHTLVPAARLFPLPDALSDEVAGGYLLRGLTAEYLVRRLYPLGPGKVAVVHAAAGGMGLLLGQWGKALGARMIGTVGSPEKAALAKTFGYESTIDYSAGDFAPQVMELTGGVGAEVIYDGIGKAAFRKSLDCIRPRGMVISYGTASGNVGEFDLQLLHSKSIIVTRPTLRSWIADPEEARAAAVATFAALTSDDIDTPIGAVLPLAEAAEAHRRLEGRETTAPIVLKP
ncbi:quinone oxidoreductase [Primorskyibacter flagellatus]|uniref:Quinone oxidoreductase n=1 Tax=Primorskyibacter flagellatus TaxID=1387277 RepID=A0A917EJJ5_9RHOB|nr:quinone oxidoreductase [Primorskyibacter flagellatus]GGE45076.1 quinone oxidoreductase [Primorskyibacter flagellatus]